VVKKNDLACRSVASKEKRSDCPLISVGIVLDAAGFIIRHKVFAGNISDCNTLLGAVSELEGIAEGESKPVVIVDGGMASQANLDALRESGYDYIVNGNMILGFGMIAWPARYGVSGIMTFAVNQEGVIYQCDLGEKTSEIIQKMVKYNPDEHVWRKVSQRDME